MTPELAAFLQSHPLTSRWLDDIVDILVGHTSGTAHVRDIAREISRKRERDVDFVEQTVTRRINDFCEDAADFDKTSGVSLFRRVNPATYRLKNYPSRPDILAIVRVEFEDKALQETWRFFSQVCKEKYSEKWEMMSNGQKLEAFAKNLQAEGILRDEYIRRLEFNKKISEIDLDLSVLKI